MSRSPEETSRSVTKTAAHLDDATSVLRHGEVHVGCGTCSPHWLHIEQVPPSAFNQLLVLDAHSSQHHPLRRVVVLQIAVEHRLVDLVYIIYGAKAWQSNCVAPICSLGTMNTDDVNGKTQSPQKQPLKHKLTFLS